MTDEQILETFGRILGDLLGRDSIDLEMDTTRSDFPDWDSFNYVNFIVAVEMELGIKFRIADVEAFRTVGDVVAETQRLLARA